MTETDERYARRYSVLAAIMLGSIMGPIDASIINTVLPTITSSFGVLLATAEWVPMVYLLTISSLLLFFGRLGDILGYKRVFLSGLGGFIITSGLCGLSPTIGWLIFARALQGLAAGMLTSVPVAIITASFPPSERGKAIGITAISISAGLAIGPSLGGLITSVLGWRYVFLINIPIGLVALFWGRHVLPALRGEPGKIDMPGAIVALVSFVCLLLAVHQFQSSGLGYLSVLPLLAACLGGVSFIWLERRAAQPMLNLSLFESRTFSIANISALLNFMSQYVMVFLTPFYLQRLLHYPPGKVGLVMTAFPLAVMSVAPWSGSLSDRIGTKRPACVGAALCALSLFLMSRLPVAAGAGDVAWRLVLFGLGTGIFQSPNISAAMGSVPKPHLGIASGVVATVRNVGMVFGIATGGAVLYASVSANVLGHGLLTGPEAVQFLSGLEHAYLAGAILTGVASVTSAFGQSQRGKQV